MTLESLEKNYRQMDKELIFQTLMRITGEITPIIIKHGEGRASFKEKVKLFLWKWSGQGRRVIALYKKISGGQRVGITTRPDQRKAQWRSIYPTMSDWTIVKSFLSYDQAQDIENSFLKKGFDGSPGGPRMGGYNYSVYTFSF